ncbi:MAG: AraC family transcriptional regulator [Clostridiales bacterium]|nr:AraC family transcriptional regulator [Clostridiales bacterium]
MKKEVMGLIVKRDDGSEIINYDDPAFPSYVYEGWICPNVTWAKVPHFHEDIEMMTVTSGSCGYVVNGKTIVLNEGDTIFVNANQIHYSTWLSEETCKYVIFIFHPSIISTSLAVEMNAVLPIIDNHELSYIRFRNINENTEEIRDLILSLPDKRRDPFAITKTVFSIWDIILRQSSAYGLLETGDTSDSHSRALKNMMYYIQTEYKNPITLDAIAGSANISKSLCNKLFQQYAQESPVNYVMHFRARKVAEYLRSSDMSLSEIASITGFSGVSYMSEIFKRFFHTSPLKYKKSWENNSRTTGQ